MSTHKTISERQLAANRANALKSTGPRTPDGKARSSQNALTHGITALSPVLSCEDRDDFNRCTALLRAQFDPRNPCEEDLFQEINSIRWQQRRVRHSENCLLEVESQTMTLPSTLESARGPMLAALAYQSLCDRSAVLALLNRRLSCLSREHHRLMTLYLQLHGPLHPPSSGEREPPAPLEIQAGQNEPILPTPAPAAISALYRPAVSTSAIQAPRESKTAPLAGPGTNQSPGRPAETAFVTGTLHGQP